MNTIFGSQHQRDLKLLLPLLHQINEKEIWAMSLTPEAAREQTTSFKEQLKNGSDLDTLLPEAFALVREAARRTLGERPYDVQLLGGIVLHQGKIMEMKTGEGKTLSSVSAAYLNALAGNGVHIITVNDYLAERDANWMKPVYDYLGISVGAIISNMDNDARRAAYSMDITYGTNNEFGFDYLRDNMSWDTKGRVQQNHSYCIIDEIDSILIDEARTPLIISGQAEDDTQRFAEVNRFIPRLKECDKDPETGEYPEEPVGDFKAEEKNKRVVFTDEGLNNIEEMLMQQGIIHESLFSDENFEYIHYFTQAVKAHKLFHHDVDYVVQEGKVQIVDEFTGRILHGRRYSDGLHQAIEAKERLKVAKRNRTLATITFQNYFRMFDKLSGMTGTADTEAREFSKIYGLEVVVIPTNRPLVRKDEDDLIFLDEGFKYTAICNEIEEANKKGQPILVGTVSIEKSELISKHLTKRGVRHEVLNAKNHAREALIIAEAGAKGSVTIATNMAGRGTDIKLGGNPDYRARKKAGTDCTPDEYRKAFLKELESWKYDYEEVKSIGGLYIIGTERHESRRVDNQLRGRSGRQGDPGKSRFFISLDDSLMRLFSGENTKNLMARIGMKGGDPVYHPLINRTIEKAQTRVEDRNFEIRKHLLDYDDVLNEQRTFLYEQRDTILTDKNLSLRILGTASDLVSDILDGFFKTKDDPKTAEIHLGDELKSRLFYILPANITDIGRMPADQLKSVVMEDLKRNIESKLADLGENEFNSFIRYQYLKYIDTKWQDHLESLEALREAVYLRAYGQKNPLLEYKLEGFDIFDKLIQDIRTTIAELVIKVQVKTSQGQNFLLNRQQQGQASHSVMGQFSGGSSGGGGGAAKTAPQKVQIKRQYPKVGRNDPCPCGSGKKYKFCHGK